MKTGDLVGWRDHEGYIWDKPEHALSYFEDRYFFLDPVYAAEGIPEERREFNVENKDK